MRMREKVSISMLGGIINLSIWIINVIINILKFDTLTSITIVIDRCW